MDIMSVLVVAAMMMVARSFQSSPQFKQNSLKAIDIQKHTID